MAVVVQMLLRKRLHTERLKYPSSSRSATTVPGRHLQHPQRRPVLDLGPASTFIDGSDEIALALVMIFPLMLCAPASAS